jgi:hypothetical protein
MVKEEKRAGTKNATSTSKTMKMMANRKNFMQKGT